MLHCRVCYNHSSSFDQFLLFEPQRCSEIELSGFNALSQPFLDEDSEDPKQSLGFFFF